MNAPTYHNLVLSIHANGMAGKGGQILVAENAPAAQIQLGKHFLKYLDPFDQGLRQGGIATNGAFMLSAGTWRSKYSYFEVEFMDAVPPTNPAGLRYADMLREDFLDRTASQIVNGVVEILVDKQPNMDTITYNPTPIGGLW